MKPRSTYRGSNPYSRTCSATIDDVRVLVRYHNMTPGGCMRWTFFYYIHVPELLSSSGHIKLGTRSDRISSMPDKGAAKLYALAQAQRIPQLRLSHAMTIGEYVDRIKKAREVIDAIQ